MTELPASIKPELVYCNLKAETKEDALRELVQVLSSAEPSIVIEEILQALDDRERKGPFSIAKGVAFPHARTEEVQEFTIVIGTKPEGLDFRAPDGQAVQIVILFVIPNKHSNLYLRTLAWFLNFFREDQSTGRVAGLSSSEELISVLNRQDTRLSPNVFRNCKFTITKETSLRSALALMTNNRIDSIPVVDADQTLIGEVTLENLLRSETVHQTEEMEDLLKNAGEASMAAFITTDTYLEVDSERPPFVLAKEIAKHQRHRAYLVKDHRLCGIATLPDLLNKCWKKE